MKWWDDLESCSARKCAALLRPPGIRIKTGRINMLQRAEVRCSIETSLVAFMRSSFWPVAARGSALLY